MGNLGEWGGLQILCGFSSSTLSRSMKSGPIKKYLRKLLQFRSIGQVLHPFGRDLWVLMASWLLWFFLCVPMVFPWFSHDYRGCFNNGQQLTRREFQHVPAPGASTWQDLGGALEIDLRQIQLAMLVKSLSNPCKTLVPNPIPGHKNHSPQLGHPWFNRNNYRPEILTSV